MSTVSNSNENDFPLTEFQKSKIRATLKRMKREYPKASPAEWVEWGAANIKKDDFLTKEETELIKAYMWFLVKESQ